jgi:AAA15 family ATPase/GTPase
MYIQDGSVSANEKIWNDWMILVETPNAPRWFTSISAGSAVLIFFITLKHWLQLPFGKRSYSTPSIILFDEIDSSIHPTLLAWFVQILRELSEKTQLIFSSHSPTFIDFFSKEEVFYLKPKEALWSIKTTKSDLLSYDQIIKCLGENDRESFLNETNSQLFINWMIDDIYPNS